MDSVAAQYRALPTLSRNIATAVFVVSLACHVELLPMDYFHFEPALLIKFPPQIWRFATNYLVTFALGIVFDSYFIFNGLQRLEVANPRFPRRVDVIWYLVVICLTILGLLHFTGQATMPFYIKPLLIALAYTGTQDQRGQQVNFFFINIPAQLLPLAMLFVALLSGGVSELVFEVHGLFAAHLYDFVSRLWPQFGGGFNLIPVPTFFANLVEGPPRRGFGRDGANTPSSGSSTGVSRGAVSMAQVWRERGQGQRLGGMG